MAEREKSMDEKVLIVIDKNDLDEITDDFRSIKESILVLAKELVELNDMVEGRMNDEEV